MAMIDNRSDLVRSDSPPSDSGSDSLRRSLRYVTFAWVFGAVWLYVTTGAALTRYAKLVGTTEFGFGLLAALPFLGALLQLPTSYFLERFGHRKKLFIAVGTIHRLCWSLIGIIPLVFPTAWWSGTFLVLVALAGFGLHITTPAWVSWMADLVPAKIRGRYFSRRNQLGQVVGIVVTITMGLALDWAKETGSTALLQTICGMFIVGGICGAMDFLMFLSVYDPPMHRPNPQVGLWTMIRQPLMDRNFRRFLGFNATMTFAIGYIGQFIWLYLFDVVKMSNTQANIMLVVVPLFVMMLSFPVWGRLVDRLGRKPVLVIAGLLVVHGGASWAFVQKDNWWLGYMAAMVATMAWPGIEIGIFNLLLNLTNAKGGQRRNTAHIAINSVVVAVAGLLSGLFAGIVARSLRDWTGTLFGWPMTYHTLLFILSAFLRLASLAWLIGLRDPEAYSTRDALRYVAAHIYSNVQQAVFMPTRLLGRLGKLSYRFNPPKR